MQTSSYLNQLIVELISTEVNLSLRALDSTYKASNPVYYTFVP